MKYFVFTAFVLPFLSFTQRTDAFLPIDNQYADTGHIVHVLDGLTSEWPSSRFQLSEDSTVEYAVDNDDKNLYVAMTIADFGEQTKIMRNGMKLFIDLKGKKKEGRGVEFPIQGEAASASGMGVNYASKPSGEEPPKKLDKKTERSLLSLAVVSLKLFGFDNVSKDEQGLTMPGSVNIAYKWDESDFMHIEYSIPLEMLGKSPSLDKKEISVGWKINGFERPQGQGEHSFQGGESGEGGGGGGGHRGMHGGGGGGGGGNGQYGGGRGFGQKPPGTYKKVDPEQMRKEQNLWTKYVIAIPVAQKAF